VPRAELETPVCSASREVHDLLEAALIKALQQHNGERKYSIKVQEAVTRLKGGVAPDIRSVSRDLGFGTRDLQLKLKQEGTTFRKLKDDCQSKLAAEYLKDTSLGIKEIAYILGFSDSRAFHRAFVRWTGETPGEARKELQDSGKV
jgi:AraC-like DNA-binding protein